MDDTAFPGLGRPDLDRLSADMNRDGYGVLRDVLPLDFLPRMRGFVADQLARRNGEYFCDFGQGGGQGAGHGAEPGAAEAPASALDALGGSTALRDLLAGLYERGTGRPAPAGEVLQVLRVLAGEGGQKHSHRFHYDAYVVTALVPIVMPPPEEEQRGDLVLFPNLRGIRSSVLTNVVEKAIVQNGAAGRLLASPAVQRRLRARVVPMEPGSMYFFWGYRSLHANRPCRPDRVRSTALFHFADPHAMSPLIRFIENRHRRAEQPAKLAA